MSGEPELSLARHALLVLGSATVVLLLTTVLLGVLQPGPTGALLVVGSGVVGCIAAMAVAARWSTRVLRRSEPGPAPD